MKSFVIFAIVVTVIYVIYYTVIIVQDLYGKPKDEKSQGESFDVSDMTDEEESIAVSESDGGFSVVNTTYSDPMFSEELINTIIARGLRHNGREMVKVESLNNEI